MNQPTDFLSHCRPQSSMEAAAASGTTAISRISIAERAYIVSSMTRFASRPIRPMTMMMITVTPVGVMAETVSSFPAKFPSASPVALSMSQEAVASETAMTPWPIVPAAAVTIRSVKNPRTMLLTVSAPRWFHTSSPQAVSRLAQAITTTSQAVDSTAHPVAEESAATSGVGTPTQNVPTAIRALSRPSRIAPAQVPMIASEAADPTDSRALPRWQVRLYQCSHSAIQDPQGMKPETPVTAVWPHRPLEGGLTFQSPSAQTMTRGQATALDRSEAGEAAMVTRASSGERTSTL